MGFDKMERQERGVQGAQESDERKGGNHRLVHPSSEPQEAQKGAKGAKGSKGRKWE